MEFRISRRSHPVHRNQDLKVGTLKALMKIAQLFEEDLL
ncbi:MAG: type II toxin-antitoxin system HicA family toxin [Nostoc sp.]